jgi:hypothetical protein
MVDSWSEKVVFKLDASLLGGWIPIGFLYTCPVPWRRDRGTLWTLEVLSFDTFQTCAKFNGGPTPRKIDANIKEVPSWHIESVEFFG